ncbi:MAG: hypothetical protein H7Y13_10690 [Sphingobacteriaceae bacterium]|nr:hypothetical protein [Sphingobacteriaceae bacterium]
MKYCWLICIIFLPFFSIAQSNYKPGYIIKTTGDTLKGFINQKEWSRSPITVAFKSDEKETSLEYGPQQIAGFAVNGVKYISYTGRYSIDKNQPPELHGELDTSSIEGSIFLKEISTGRFVTLYSQSDNTKERFFIKESQTKPVELKFHQYYNDNNSIISKSLYRTKLGVLVFKYASASNKSQLLKKLESIEFNETKLNSFIQNINQLDKNEVKRRVSTTLFAGLGINRGSTFFDGYYKDRFAPSNSISPRISAGFDLYNNPFVKQLILRGEIGFSYLKADMRKSTYPYYTFNQYTASIIPQIIYNFYNTEKLRVYLGGGAGFNFSKYTNNKYSEGRNNLQVYDNYFKLEPVWMSFPLQTGAFIRDKYEISVVYILPTAYTKYSNFSISTETLGLNVRYSFGK